MKKVSHKNLYVRDPETGEFNPLMAIRGESAYDIAVRLGKFSGTEEEWDNFIELERAAAVKSIEDKGAETLASIPEDYTALDRIVGNYSISTSDFRTNIANAFTWTSKNMDASGNIVDDTTGGLRIVTTDLIDISKDDFWEVRTKNNCKVSIVYYDENGIFIYNTPKITKHIINHNGKFRFLIFGDTETLSPTSADKYISICRIENIASGNNLLNPCDFPLSSIGNLTVEIDGGLIKVNGTGTARVRLSNRPVISRSPIDLVDINGVDIFEDGKRYNLLVTLVSGSEPSGNVSGIVLVDAESNIISTSARSTYLHDENKPVSAVTFHAVEGTYENAVYSVAIVEVDDGEERISPELTSRFFDTSPAKSKELAEYLKSVTYPTINKLYATSVFNQANINDDGHYKSFQGFASDHKRYLFNAVYWSDITLNSTLQKFDLETGELILSVTDHCYGKPHDMTYCPLDNMIYIIDSQSYETCCVYVVNADTLQYVREFTLGEELAEKINGFAGMAAIDYNAKRQKFIFQERQYENQVFAIYDKDMKFEKTLRIDSSIFMPVLENLPHHAIQGMSTDDKFIYTTYYGINAGDVSENYIYAWDWHGNFVFSVPVQYNGGEVEGMSKVGNEIYMNLNGTYDFIKCIPSDVGYRYIADVLSQYNLN